MPPFCPPELRRALERLSAGSGSECRDCGELLPATKEHFHIKQLKAFLKDGEVPGSMVCLSCAASSKADEHRGPLGVELDALTGVPLKPMKRCQAYRNNELRWPYTEGGGSPSPSAWLTCTSALLDLDGFRYYPNFLSEDEEQRILDILDADGGVRWSKVFRRRQQFFGEVYYHTAQNEAKVQPSMTPGPSAVRPEDGEDCKVVAFPMEPFAFLVDKFYDCFWEKAEACEGGGHVFGADRRDFPTQILVNEYLENFGISSHFEDEEAFGKVIATISLLAPIYMQLEKPTEHTNQCHTLKGCTKVLLEPRSLFVMSRSCRFDWRHGITRQSVLPVPEGCSSSCCSSAEASVPATNGDGVPMAAVLRDATYRRVSLTIRHLLPGRKQVSKHQRSEAVASENQQELELLQLMQQVVSKWREDQKSTSNRGNTA